MANPTLRPHLTSLSSTQLPSDRSQNGTPAGSTVLSVNHRVILTALSAITPLLVLMNCLDQIQGAFVAVPMRPTFAMAQPAHSGPDYLGIHAKLLWAYAPPGEMAQPVRCIPVAMP